MYETAIVLLCISRNLSKLYKMLDLSIKIWYYNGKKFSEVIFMQYEIKGTPLPVVICNIGAGESIYTEKGGMSWMTPNMQMSTNAGG